MRQLAALLLEDRKAALQRLAEACLFELQRLGDQRLGAQQLGIGLAHLAAQRRHQLPHQGLARPEQFGVAHRASHDPPQHIAAALVGGQHAVGDEEGARAQMVGDDPVRGLERPVGVDPGLVDHGLDKRPEQVDGVIVVGALEHRGHAFEAHAGVDRGLGQFEPVPVGKLLVLHEHQVPDLDEAVAVGVGRAGRAAGDMLAVVVENLRAGAARAGVAHRPEIIGGGDADDAPVRQAGNLLPKAESLVVLGVDRDDQPVLGEAEFLGDQVPGELDRALLEVVAEREVPQHFEEGVVARGVADIVEIVVLAAGAHAFLRGHGAHIGALLHAGEDVLELHHAGVGEHQRRVVARHERG